MFTFSEAEIGQMIGQYLWPLFRIASFLMIVPIFGANFVNARVRLSLALAITVAVVPTLPEAPALDPTSMQAMLLVMYQVIIGMAMGYAVTVLFQVFVVAGQVMAMQMGLGFAAMVDPANGITVAAVSQFYLMMVTLLFLAMNGHLVLFEALVHSFTVMPIEAGSLSGSAFWLLASRVSWMFSAAMMIALPSVTALLLVNLSFGVMTRAAPQMNIFSIGFPMTVLFGLVAIWATFGEVLPQFQLLSEQTFEFMNEFIQAK
ncbi:flagellar biosynthetic protein FliR [Allohahella sp. A8]|uniref:flagellar biosynthetic protein FliR n=1 Tax=Allohahella sp. A8 TaxID=3141461 RepID=UPI000C09071E|nr:flagellar biosynthetic protein FliR [Hahellaceae bacterium]|tara:strand:+ start:75655 stop:76434 length:780 start_codon:yes stop_codon:yes gene_type:complete